MGVKSDATFKSSLKYTTMPKKQEKTAELQRRLQFNENGIDYGVSSLGFKIIWSVNDGAAGIPPRFQQFSTKKTKSVSGIFSPIQTLCRDRNTTSLVFLPGTCRRPTVDKPLGTYIISV